VLIFGVSRFGGTIETDRDNRGGIRVKISVAKVFPVRIWDMPYVYYFCTGIGTYIKYTVMAATVLEITSREFREKQRSYLELADDGVQIILKRGRKRSYILTPVQDDDLIISSKLQERIDRGLQEIKEGKTIAMQPGETLDAFLKRTGECIE
jgi:hypothetical protein